MKQDEVFVYNSNNLGDSSCGRMTVQTVPSCQKNFKYFHRAFKAVDCEDHIDCVSRQETRIQNVILP